MDYFSVYTKPKKGNKFSGINFQTKCFIRNASYISVKCPIFRKYRFVEEKRIPNGKLFFANIYFL